MNGMAPPRSGDASRKGGFHVDAAAAQTPRRTSSHSFALRRTTPGDVVVDGRSNVSSRVECGRPLADEPRDVLSEKCLHLLQWDAQRWGSVKGCAGKQEEVMARLCV